MNVPFVKQKPKGLQSLSEKEIQERLYGKYSAKKSSPVPSSHQSDIKPKTENINPPQIEYPSTVRPDWQEVAREYVEQLKPVVTASFKKVPWRLVGIALAVFLASILLIRSVTHLATLREATREQATTSLQASPLGEISEVDPSVRVNPSSALSAPQSREAQGQTPASVSQMDNSGDGIDKKPTPAPRFYAVQICTYNRETDATKLVTELNGLNFKPFYRKMISRQRGTPYFVVFLGQKQTFAGAEALLKQFQGTSLFSQFTDSFIRSL